MAHPYVALFDVWVGRRRCAEPGKSPPKRSLNGAPSGVKERDSLGQPPKAGLSGPTAGNALALKRYLFECPWFEDSDAPRVNVMVEKSSVKLSKSATTSCPRLPYNSALFDPVPAV